MAFIHSFADNWNIDISELPVNEMKAGEGSGGSFSILRELVQDYIRSGCFGIWEMIV